jgi:hypothetical protein
VASPAELETITHQVERLARSRLWTSARDSIAKLYEQAFGTGPEETMTQSKPSAPTPRK